MATVWRKTAEFHLKTGEAKVAAESLEELQRLEPSLTTLAQLVTAYAKCDLGQKVLLLLSDIMKNRLIYACAEDEAFDILLVRIKTHFLQARLLPRPRSYHHSSLLKILTLTV